MKGTEQESKQYRYSLQTVSLFIFTDEIHAQVTIAVGLIEVSIKASKSEHSEIRGGGSGSHTSVQIRRSN